MTNRLKLLRKELHLTQQSFSKRIGLSRDAYKNLEYGLVEVKENIILLILKEFQVNEAWLREGEGEMFAPEPDYYSLDDFSKKNGMTELEKGIFESYLSMDKNARMVFMDKISKVFQTYQENKEQDDIDSKVAAYRAELEAEMGKSDVTPKRKQNE